MERKTETLLNSQLSSLNSRVMKMKENENEPFSSSSSPSPEPDPDKTDDSDCSASSTPRLLPDLPDEISLLCIARVPRLYHSDLSLVCKSWRSTLRSPHFFSIRSHLNCTQNLLFINVRIHGSSFKCYILDCTGAGAGPRILSHVPPMPSHPIGSAYAVLGPRIFVIGGSINDVPSPSVWIFDSRFSRWEIGPKMRVGREFAAAGVVNGRIYVLGGCAVDSWTRSTHWAEVFDPVAGAWAPVPSPVDVQEKWMHGSAVLDDKIYAMADRGGVVYDPKEMSWGYVPTELDLGWRGRAAVVDGVLYCYDYLGKIRGFVSEDCAWKQLRGLEKGLPTFLCGATMANVGGNLCVVWEGKGMPNQMEISCAVIDVCKDSCGELWGLIVWSQVILVVPRGSSIVHCLDVGL